jgi:hypothetical protein
VDGAGALGELFDDAEFLGDGFAGELAAVGGLAREDLLESGHSRTRWKFISAKPYLTRA